MDSRREKPSWLREEEAISFLEDGQDGFEMTVGSDLRGQSSGDRPVAT